MGTKRLTGEGEGRERPDGDGEDALTLGLWRAFGWAMMCDPAESKDARLALLARQRLVEANRAEVRKEAVRLAVEQKDTASRIVRLTAELEEVRRLYADMALERGRIRAALAGLLENSYDHRDPLGEVERFGGAYYRDTGYIRPGKSDPLRDSNSTENVDRYRAWTQARRATAIDEARAALAVMEGE